MRRPTSQLILLPQDVVVGIKLRFMKGLDFTYSSLAQSLFLVPSQVHSSMKRLAAARILSKDNSAVFSPALVEFLIHGAKYAYPAQVGAPTRGLPTAFGAPAMRLRVTQDDKDAPVWPFSLGDSRGPGLIPLYPKAVEACMADQKLYEVLSLFDALRVGAARERSLATEMLEERLA